MWLCVVLFLNFVVVFLNWRELAGNEVFQKPLKSF